MTDDEVLTPMLRYRGLVRIMITCVRQTEKQKDCRADVTRSGGSWKTSFGWIYGHQYYVILAKVLFLFFFKTINVLAFFFTILFCYRIKIINYFIGAKQKAIETFLHRLLNKPLSKINQIFCVESLFDFKTLP